MTIDGPYRFHPVSGRTGFVATSLKSHARVETDLHREPRGTLTLWFSPLEDLTSSPPNQSLSKIPFEFSFLADCRASRGLDHMHFGLAASASYPPLLARFASGAVWSRMDYGVAPFVYAEKVLLRRGYWYHVALTWDRPAKRLVLYLNGQMVGHNYEPENFEEAAPELFVGHPMFVLRALHLENRVLSRDEIAARYAADRPKANDLPDADLHAMLDPLDLPPLDLKRDSTWKPAYACAFTQARDLDDWVRQGPGERFMDGFRMETTAEGLLLKTPDPVHIDSRMYLWSRKQFEGDQWIEFDFRLESPRGLALLVACASGMQREDFIAEHGIAPTGGMGTILRDVRNYHWEFMRRVEGLRTDVETQYAAKNPFGRTFHSGCIPRFQENRWYRLRFIVAGRRLHGSIDGQTVFDFTDDPFINNGPVYNFGRIALRQMYYTTLRYRNLEVFEREPEPLW